MMTRNSILPVLALGAITSTLTTSTLNAAAMISGELKQWHKVTLDIDGPEAGEMDVSPNPFTDYRFEVKFTHASGSPSYRVPGYFAADGDAGETSADSGSTWRAHLSPDKTGRWDYRVTFLRGDHAAIGGDGKPLKPFDGLEGSFKIGASDKNGRDFRSRGRLTYVGEHHLQFAGSKEYFLKVGADAPETLLAYTDFDGTETRKQNAPLKTWGPHVKDWRPGDLSWKDGKGRGLVGAINYLEGEAMNAFSFLTYAAGGDGDNVWPFVDRDDKMHYDCSKLDQWGMVFDYGNARGMYLHFKLTERENSGVIMKNSRAMDVGELGPERKLYLREMIARYGYLLALNWNLGEENSQTVSQQRDTAAFIVETDPYNHLIVTHTGGRWEAHQKVYPHLLGEQSALTGVSLQTRSILDTHRFVVHWLRESANAGKPWVVANDEQDLGSTGTPPDPGYQGYQQEEGPTLHEIRKYALWGTLMAGGAGIEYYFGYKHPQNDIVCEDWRSRDRTWDYARHAHEVFIRNKIPFWEMKNADALVGNSENDNTRYCLTKAGEVYLVYLTQGGTSELDLTDAQGEFAVKWFNPRHGGALQDGAIRTVTGGKTVALGQPPVEPDEDWLAVVRR